MGWQTYEVSKRLAERQAHIAVMEADPICIANQPSPEIPDCRKLSGATFINRELRIQGVGQTQTLVSQPQALSANIQ